jgi:hypothetical protein
MYLKGLWVHTWDTGLRYQSTIQKKTEVLETSETLEGFCFDISVTGFSRPNAGKDDGDAGGGDDDVME